MSIETLALLIITAPSAFVIAALTSWFQPGFRPQLVKRVSRYAAIFNIVVALFAAILVSEHGLLESGFIGFREFGFSIRLDALSTLMLGMIALLGFIIIKFSANYLDGDQRQGAFIGRLTATIASVQLLVLSGNLGLLLISWILTSMSLQRLLLFYHERHGAQVAARKKFILARLGDVSLFISILMRYSQYGTGNLELIFAAIGEVSFDSAPFQAIEGPALFLALAAMLKSAQFPTHGWLIEVMETPTPVSALLHAGLLNAGPFLIIRMADLMHASTVAPIMLMIIGGFTALFASVVFLTQTSVKTALAYSSIAHMGFSLMVSGLGVYPAAMLHLVAHSFYKAHAFLSSGSVIDTMRAATSKLQRTLHPVKMLLGTLVAFALYAAFAWVWGLDPQQDFGLLILGGVLVLGMTRMLAVLADSASGPLLIARIAAMALLVTTAFFSLEAGMHWILQSQLPELEMIGMAKLVVAIGILSVFALIIGIQVYAPALADRPAYRTLVIHVRNGLYANAVFDRIIGALRIRGEVQDYSTFELREQQRSRKERAMELEEQLA